ncbi:MAG TPA: hypothetical protein VFE47_30825 [Tepidisphaeraceae bacterium]|jgi:hypothetical protein|nr:hypothetical protein [Tepidisphaeraceae bacterium]
MSLLDQLDSLETQRQADARAEAQAKADAIAAAKCEYLILWKRRHAPRPGDGKQLLAMAAAAGISEQHHAELIDAIKRATAICKQIADDPEIAALEKQDKAAESESRRIIIEMVTARVTEMNGYELRSAVDVIRGLVRTETRPGIYEFHPLNQKLNEAASTLNTFSQAARARELNQSVQHQIAALRCALTGPARLDFEDIILDERRVVND